MKKGNMIQKNFKKCLVFGELAISLLVSSNKSGTNTNNPVDDTKTKKDKKQIKIDIKKSPVKKTITYNFGTEKRTIDTSKNIEEEPIIEENNNSRKK